MDDGKPYKVLYLATVDHSLVAIDTHFVRHLLPLDTDRGERSLCMHELIRHKDMFRSAMKGSGRLTLEPSPLKRNNKDRRTTICDPECVDPSLIRAVEHTPIAPKRHPKEKETKSTLTRLSTCNPIPKGRSITENVNHIIPTRATKRESRKVFVIENIVENDFRSLRDKLATRLPDL